MSRMSKLDPSQIQKTEHDDVSGAKKVTMVNTDFSIELDHTDGDSVTAHCPLLTASVTGVEVSDSEVIIPPLNCQTMKTIRVDVDGDVRVRLEASPNDSGNYFYPVGDEGIVHTVCARRVRVVIDISGTGDVHLVGQG